MDLESSRSRKLRSGIGTDVREIERRPLRLLASRASDLVLALQHGPLGAGVLEKAMPNLSENTVRKYRNRLEDYGHIVRHDEGGTSRRVIFSLSESGEALIPVFKLAENYHRHLSQAAESTEAVDPSSLYGAIAEGWRVTLLPRLGFGELTRSDLERCIPGFSLKELMTRLERLERLSIIETFTAPPGSGKLYALTQFGRLSAVPLVHAAHWEYRYQPVISPLLGTKGAIAAVRMLLDLVKPDPESEGIFQIVAVESDSRACSLEIAIDSGEPVPTARETASSAPDAWLRTSPEELLAAVVEGRLRTLAVGGNIELGMDVMASLNSVANLRNLPT